MSNKYTKTLATGLLVLSLNGTVVSQEENQPEQPAQVENTLISTPDAGTELNEDLAAKVRKLAELVMTKEKGEFKKEEDEQFGTIVTTRIPSGESKGYDIIVYDDNGSAEVISPENIPVDLILVVEYSLIETNKRVVYGFVDGGLDGNLNSAKTYIAPTSNLFPPEDLIDYEFEENQLKEVKIFEKDYSEGVLKGAEYQETFQNEFERVVNELIKLYEK